MTNDFLARMCDRRETKEITVRGQTMEMRLLSAMELLELSAACGAAGEELSLADTLEGHAALAAKCLLRGGKPVFSTAAEAMEILAAEEIHAVAAAYACWSREADPGMDSGAEWVETLKKDSGTRRKNGCAGAC